MYSFNIFIVTAWNYLGLFYFCFQISLLSWEVSYMCNKLYLFFYQNTQFNHFYLYSPGTRRRTRERNIQQARDNSPERRAFQPPHMMASQIHPASLPSNHHRTGQRPIIMEQVRGVFFDSEPIYINTIKLLWSPLKISLIREILLNDFMNGK